MKLSELDIELTEVRPRRTEGWLWAFALAGILAWAAWLLAPPFMELRQLRLQLAELEAQAWKRQTRVGVPSPKREEVSSAMLRRMRLMHASWPVRLTEIERCTDVNAGHVVDRIQIDAERGSVLLTLRLGNAMQLEQFMSCLSARMEKPQWSIGQISTSDSSRLVGQTEPGSKIVAELVWAPIALKSSEDR